MNILVMGIGNLLLSDEGAGVRVVEEFQDRYRVPEGVEVIDGGTMGIELLHYIQNRDAVIIVDVVRTGNPPGTIIRLEGADVPALFNSKISPHQLGLSDLLAAAQLTDSMPRRIVLLGIEPKSMDTGLELSDEVRAGVPRLAALIVEELASLGLAATPEASASPRKTIP
ncbi:MAG: HyaD/HybD family hydrogenase maturation endopeptidase [Nitrospirota bacterium]